jgi:hypothetical protein
VIAVSTTPVLFTTCLGVGHVTFLNSALASLKNLKGERLGLFAAAAFKAFLWFSRFSFSLALSTDVFFSSDIFTVSPFLFSFLVFRVLAAELAVFFHLKPVRVVLFVLFGVVVALLALLASECDFHSHYRHLLNISPYNGGTASLVY